jgi:hypothetical protein
MINFRSEREARSMLLSQAITTYEARHAGKFQGDYGDSRKSYSLGFLDGFMEAMEQILDSDILYAEEADRAKKLHDSARKELRDI